MNEKKLRQIEESYINGQKKQMVQQIKAYGVKAFHVDFWDYLKYAGYTDFKGQYSAIVYTFHLLNN